MHKDFDGWNIIKQKLNCVPNQMRLFSQREIWWCKVGLNVGHEENGKGVDYSRPVLVVKKFNNHIFLGIPLTTQIKEKHYYHRINFKNREQCAMLSQLRLFGSERLMNKMGKLSQEQFDEIRKILKEMM